ncbi:MAG: T9SS type A sorting domain-containing protein [Flavobacterium sp.]|nr:T9SS type A sorting domain-containing protein [Flavobacterium sp.]
MRHRLLLVFTLLNMCLSADAQTIDATLVEINYSSSSNPENITKGITKIYFSAEGNGNGRELYVYDFITNTTKLVKEIYVGWQSGIDNSTFITIGDILYFIGTDPVNGIELWRSDGTAAGTYLVKNINPTGDVNFVDSNIGELTVYNGKIVFSATDGVNGQELWISDGTNTGTFMLNDIRLGATGSTPTDLFVFNNEIYFTASDGIVGREIWKSNGTSSGLSLLKDIAPSASGLSSGNHFIIFNNNFYFYAKTGGGFSGYDLWKSDGTAAGTIFVKDLPQSFNNDDLAILGIATSNYFVFRVTATSIGYELWISDGTDSGTHLLKDINPVSDGLESDCQFTLLNDKVFFIANDNIHGKELWVTDGSMNGTEMVKDIQIGDGSTTITKLTAASNFLIFSAYVNALNPDYPTLWKSDGTESGTSQIKDINVGINDVNVDYIPINNEVFFAAQTNFNGVELWHTDGTESNTQLFEDVNRSAGYAPQDFTELNGNVVFFSGHGNSTGWEPFITDGTINGTHLIKDVNPDTGSIASLNDISPEFLKVGGNAYYRGYINAFGYELHKTDGTFANTGLIKDIAPGTANSIDENTLFMEYNGIMYFKANDQVHGNELWRTDGTDAGTYMIKDINVGAGSSISGSNSSFVSSYKRYAVLNNRLYFVAYDGTDYSLWSTDGTDGGTIKSITLPSAGSYDARIIINATSSKIFFISNSLNDPNQGLQTLWSSDGSTAGTIQIGVWASTLSGLPFKKSTVFNDELYFSAKNINNHVLMKTDGTVAGTVMLKDDFTRNFSYMDVCGEFVYFSFTDLTFGTNYLDKELWRTDGTPAGTTLLPPVNATYITLSGYTCLQDRLIYLSDTFPKRISITDGFVSNSYDFNIVNGINFIDYERIDHRAIKVIGDKLYFGATNNRSGNELYISGMQSFLNTTEHNSINKIENDVIIAPNPSNGFISITTNQKNTLILSIDIYNLLGEKIISNKCNEISPNLNLSNLDKGLYLVTIKTGMSTITKKILIK